MKSKTATVFNKKKFINEGNETVRHLLSQTVGKQASRRFSRRYPARRKVRGESMTGIGNPKGI